MFGHAEVEGERRGLYPVWAQPDGAERVRSLVSARYWRDWATGKSRREKRSMAWWGKWKKRDQGRGFTPFLFCLSDFAVLQVIRVIHRLFSTASRVAPADYAVLQVLHTKVSPRHKR